MPQASDELRAIMERRFGDPVGDTGPMQALEESGYTLNRDWTWSHPHVTDVSQMTRGDWECLLFLVQEWDFGGLKPQETKT